MDFVVVEDVGEVWYLFGVVFWIGFLWVYCVG